MADRDWCEIMSLQRIHFDERLCRVRVVLLRADVRVRHLAGVVRPQRTEASDRGAQRVAPKSARRLGHDASSSPHDARGPDSSRASARAVAFALTAFQENLLISIRLRTSSTARRPSDRTFRLGGMVTGRQFQARGRQPRGPLRRDRHGEDVTVSYTGVLPDLFREGQGWWPAAARQGRRVRRRGGARQAR